MSQRARDIAEAYTIKHSERAVLNQLWQEIAEVLSPERLGFVSTTRATRSSDKVFDTTPMVAKRGLVNAIGSMLRPKSAAPGKWFDIVTQEEDLMENRAVKEWLEFAEERLWRSLYNPRAKFIEVTGEVDDDLITFGTGCGFLGLRGDRLGLLFRSFHLASTMFETDADNEINVVYVHEKLTPRQAAGRWGEENLGEKTRKALAESDRKKAEERFEFIWVVKPRHEFDSRVKNNLNMPVMSLVIDVASEHEVEEQGFEEFPFFLPRWDTRSGEVYGRGIGVLALPDVLSLQQMGKSMLRGLHRAVSPPWLLPADGMVNAPQMKPDGISYYDAKAIRNLGLRNPFIQMESRAQIPWGLNAQQAYREQIFALFYRNVLNLPIDAPTMTATEVIARREMFVREIGAVFGRLESDYTGPITERAFNIMLRAGAFGQIHDIPEEIQGAEISFRFASPIEKAKRQIEEATVFQGLERVMAIGQVQPEIMQRYNWDAIGKFIAEANDFPPQLTYDDATVEKIAAQAEQQQLEELAMQGVERGAGALGHMPEQLLEGMAPVPDIAEALSG